MSTYTKRSLSPFRFDHVGSFLRPQKLLDARAAFAAGQLDQAGLTAVEDETIIDLIHKEEAVGLKAITDGEFRRSWYHLDFFWGLQGIKKITTAGWQLHDGTTARGEGAELTGKLGGKNHPFIQHFEFIRDHISAGSTVKFTLPSPAYLYIQLHFPDVVAQTKAIYPEEADLIQDIANAYDEVLQDLADAGLKTVQFDDSAWSDLIAAKIVATPKGWGELTQTQLDQRKQTLLQVNNLTIDGAPADLIINAHICRGNYKSNWAYSGSYDQVADPLFTKEKINGFYLEYDTKRAGGFEVLKTVPQSKWVVLGLVTSKDGQLEDRQVIIDRIREAAQYFPLDHLCVSPQCGFASSEEGNTLTEAQQWAKLAMLQSIAKEVWHD